MRKAFNNLGWIPKVLLLFWYMALVPWVISLAADLEKELAIAIVVGVIGLPATILPFIKYMFPRKETDHDRTIDE